LKPLLGHVLLAVPVYRFFRILRTRKAEQPWLPWVALWFLAAYGPSSGILIPVNAIFLEHWMYLPSLSLFIGLGVAMQRYGSGPRRTKAIIAASVLAALALGYRTYEQNWVWQSPISLFSHILKYNPAAGRVRHNLAMALDESGRTEEAIKEYEFIIAHGGNFPQTYHNLGQIHFRAGRFDVAEKNELKAIELAPNFHPPYVGMAKIHQARGDSKKAQEYYEKAVELVR
ncbi:MAG: tetratricopeptide repeat protein, partial [Bdellovibrionota bacterium]